MLRCLALLCLLLFPVPALACPVGPAPDATLQPVDIDIPDQGLLTLAVLHQVNRLRCQSDTPALAASFRLAEVAARHSRWMALARVVSHGSQVPNQETLSDRLRASREAFRKGAENIGYVSGCNRSYLEVADAMVRWWRDSAPHLSNMMNPDLARGGAGIAFADGCARAYLTLDMIDQAPEPGVSR